MKSGRRRGEGSHHEVRQGPQEPTHSVQGRAFPKQFLGRGRQEERQEQHLAVTVQDNFLQVLEVSIVDESSEVGTIRGWNWGEMGED